MTDVETAKAIIAANVYMTLATSSKVGEPWVSPVFFAYDQRYNLYWVSNKEARHSLLIEQNPKVAIVIFDSQAPEGEGDAVYLECLASELNNENDISSAIRVLGERVTRDEFKVKSAEEVMGSKVWRIYRAIPQAASKLSRGEIKGGQYIDTRVEVNLNEER